MSLAIDQSDTTWRLVRQYVERRIDSLRDRACNVELTDKERLLAAAGVAELRGLLGAPEEAQRQAASRLISSTETY